MEATTSEVLLKRLKKGTGATSDSGLGTMLGVSQQSVSNARKGSKIPDSWIRIAAERFDLSADWLFFGEGSMDRGKEAQNTSPPNQNIDRKVLLEVVETLEEFLQNARKMLPPKAKAELVYQLYQLVIEEEVDTKIQPLRMFRLIQNAMAANE